MGRQKQELRTLRQIVSTFYQLIDQDCPQPRWNQFAHIMGFGLKSNEQTIDYRPLSSRFSARDPQTVSKSHACAGVSRDPEARQGCLWKWHGSEDINYLIEDGGGALAIISIIDIKRIRTAVKPNMMRWNSLGCGGDFLIQCIVNCGSSSPAATSSKW